jgi:hypothetical protein
MPCAGRMKKFIFRRFFGINKRSFHYEMDKKSVLSQWIKPIEKQKNQRPSALITN